MGDHHARPRVEAVYFGGDESKYTRMARVLKHTAQRYCPDWHISVRPIDPAPVKSAINHLLCEVNTQKLDEWWRIIMNAPVGDRILLIDADTFITRPIDDIWARDFDIAYTVRTFELPINGGVMFVRVTPETQAFVDRWRYHNHRMLVDGDLHIAWKNLYGGINQASFGYMISCIDQPLNFLPLSCTEWNCEDSCWHRFDPGVTRIVHVKSGLRRLIFPRVGAPPTPPDVEQVLRPIVDRWIALEQEATHVLA